MKCTKENCQGFDSCSEAEFIEYEFCVKRKVKGKIDAGVPDGVCKECEYLQSLCYCTFMRENRISDGIPECRKDCCAVKFGKVWILKSKLNDFN